MNDETLKELRTITLFIWAAYIPIVIIATLADPAWYIPFTSWRLFPLLAMVLLLAALFCIARDLIFQRKDAEEEKES